MSNIFISVIIPVYNVELYLRQCLDSLLSQTYSNWECVIVDDGSTDNSGKICDEYALRDKRIRVIHKDNGGSSAARHTAFINSSGEYICAIDADDWVEPNHIENIVRSAVESNADIVLIPYYANFPEEQRLYKAVPSAFDKKNLQREALEGKVHAGLWCKLIARHIIIDNNIEPAPYDYGEDLYLYLICLEYAKKVVYNSVPTYHFRQHSFSMSNDQDMNKRIIRYEELMLNLETICEKFDYLNDVELRNAVYTHVNINKSRLMNYFLRYNVIRPYLLKYFKDSPSIFQVCDFRSWGIKHAISGNVFPYFLFKIYHRTSKFIQQQLLKI